MQKLHSHYKITPQNYEDYYWYIAFIQIISNIEKVECILKSLKEDFYIWAPYYQEYCKISFNVLLVDRLLYPGYIIIGLKNIETFDKLNTLLLQDHIGYMLGNYKENIKKHEFDQMVNVSNKVKDESIGNFDIRVGDTIFINSGPCSGLYGKVKKIVKNGDVTLNVFFMGRDITMITSILNIQHADSPVKNEKIFRHFKRT